MSVFVGFPPFYGWTVFCKKAAKAAISAGFETALKKNVSKEYRDMESLSFAGRRLLLLIFTLKKCNYCSFVDK